MRLSTLYMYVSPHSSSLSLLFHDPSFGVLEQLGGALS